MTLTGFRGMTVRSLLTRAMPAVVGMFLGSAGCLPAAHFLLPAWYGDNMVLQQNAENLPRTEIWGWADKGEKIFMDFQGRKENETADKKTGIFRFELKRLVVGTPSDMVFLNKANQELQRLTNVVAGEVWLLGSLPTADAPFHPVRAERIEKQLASRPGGGWRYLAVQALTNAQRGTPINLAWRVATAEDLQPGKRRFSNQAAYLAQELLANGRTVGYVGIVETRQVELATRVQSPLELPRKGGSIGQAFNAYETLLNTRRDYEDDLARFRFEVANLKRVGRVSPAQPPVEIKPPGFYRTGRLADLDVAIRGVIW